MPCAVILETKEKVGNPVTTGKLVRRVLDYVLILLRKQDKINKDFHLCSPMFWFWFCLIHGIIIQMSTQKEKEDNDRVLWTEWIRTYKSVTSECCFNKRFCAKLSSRNAQKGDLVCQRRTVYAHATKCIFVVCSDTSYCM